MVDMNTDCSVLVCGGSDSAQVVTGLIATRYKTVAMFLSEGEAQRWKRAVGNSAFELVIENAAVNKIMSRPADITSDPSAAQDADVIILAVPSHLHGEYLVKLAPYMKRGAIVGAMPARSGADLLFATAVGDKAKDTVFVGFETLPWACRRDESGCKATILGTKAKVCAGVTPASQAQRAIATFQGLFGVFPLVVGSPSNLGISLRNPGLVVHPGVMYSRWGPESDWDGKPLKQKPLFYQGVDSLTESVLLGMGDEIQAVCRKMERSLPGLSLKDACTLKQWYLDCYDGQMADTSTLRACMNTNKALSGLPHPCKGQAGSFMPDLQSRYLAEDVPTGLCFAKGLGEILGIATPTLDKVLLWAQDCLGLEIMVDGKMQGKDVSKTRAPQGMGIHTLEHFIQVSRLRSNLKAPSALASLALCCSG